MTIHDTEATLTSSVRRVAAQFKELKLHAARGGREVMDALVETAQFSQAHDLPTLVAEIEAAIAHILAVMPAYAPPLNVMHRVLSIAEEAQTNGNSAEDLRKRIWLEAQSFHHWSQSARRDISAIGAALIPDSTTVFTYTLSETALQTFRVAAVSGKRFCVLVTESRPNTDGLETAKLLTESGIEVAISIDACIGQFMPQVDLVLIGAEAIRADGSAIAKIGTYPVALAAAQYSVPVYIVVDTLKFDVSSSLGMPLNLDPIPWQTVLSDDTAPGTRVVGHLFDRTPPDLIRGIITERGLLSPEVSGSIMQTMPVSQRLRQRLIVNHSLHHNDHSSSK